MKTFKRIIASTVAALMILASLLTVNVFADAVEFTDVPADYYYKTAIDSLVANGVINGYTEEDGTSTFRPENTITRAEFAKLVAAATAKGVALTETTAQFPDVPADHWANTYIAYAVKAGIVNGYEDGTFRPSNPVTYGEAIKMLVCVKGYASVYTATNPWYDGWIQIANKINLTKNAMALGANPAPRGLVAQLVYNLDYCTKIEITTSSGGFNVSGGVDDEDDELEEATGMVVGVFETTLTGQNMGLNKYQIMIGDYVYDISESGKDIDYFYNYLGYEADVKYEEGTKRVLKEFVSVTPDMLTIKADDIDDVEGNVIEYYASETASKVTEAKLSSDLYVIYNGYGVAQDEIDSDFIEEYLFIDNGEITLMNSIGGKEYDVAWVTSYETYYVTSSSLSGDVFTITDSYAGKTISFNRKDCTLFTVSGESLTKSTAKEMSTVSTISTKSVLSIAQPYGSDKEGTEVIVCTYKLTGEVSEMSGYDEVGIGSKTYETSKYFLELEEADSNTYGFSRGDSGTFYFDYTGDIVLYTETESTDPYAYVLGFDSGSGLAGTCSINLLLISSNTVKAYGFADSVKVNGSSKTPSELGSILYKNADAITGRWDGDDIENGEYSQLIRYKTATKNGITVISEVYTIDPDDLANGNIVPGQINLETGKDYFSDGSGLKVSSTSGTTRTFVDANGSNQFIVNSSTAVVLVPSDRSSEDARKTTYSHFNSTGTKYIVEPYDIKSNVAKVVIVYTDTTSVVNVYAYTNVAFIDSISTVRNSDGDTVQKLTYYVAGETSSKTIETEKSNTLDGINPGDIVKLGIDSVDNVLVAVQNVFVGGKLYDYSSEADDEEFDTFVSDSNYITKLHNNDADYYNVMYGTVHNSDIDENNAGMITVVPQIEEYDSDTSNYEAYTLTSSTKVYKWNDDDDKLEVASAGEIVPAISETGDYNFDGATKVVIVRINNAIKCVYIIEE